MLSLLLFRLTVDPPHCDLCDGVSLSSVSTQRTVLHHSHPVAPDTCNGICTCCGFFGLPRTEHPLLTVGMKHVGIVHKSFTPAFGVLSTIFRPPRNADS